jgi:hypothetical protein
MKKVKTTEVIIERDELWVVRGPRPRAPGRCELCGETEFVTPETAAALAGVNTRTIYRLVEAGLIHFLETPEGSVLVCLRSLTTAMHHRKGAS